jgi:hypothetical protein
MRPGPRWNLWACVPASILWACGLCARRLTKAALSALERDTIVACRSDARSSYAFSHDGSQSGLPRCSSKTIEGS